jgi:hypothetical protein
MRIKFREKWDEAKGGEAVDLVNFESQRSKNKSEYSKIENTRIKISTTTKTEFDTRDPKHTNSRVTGLNYPTISRNHTTKPTSSTTDPHFVQTTFFQTFFLFKIRRRNHHRLI